MPLVPVLVACGFPTIPPLAAIPKSTSWNATTISIAFGCPHPDPWSGAFRFLPPCSPNSSPLPTPPAPSTTPNSNLLGLSCKTKLLPNALTFDVRERTIKSYTDNLNTLYWDRRGSVTTTSPTATLLRQHALHQRFHCYSKLRDYIPGTFNRLSPIHPLAPLHHPTHTRFLHDLRLATQEVAQGVVPSRAREATAHWNTWVTFCQELHVDPTLYQIQDPIPFLQVFAWRYRHGLINTSRRQVCSRTVEGALCNIGQAFTTVGAQDPRCTPHGDIDFRLQRMLAAYRKQDPPPIRVTPIPVPLLQHIMTQAIRSQSPMDLAIADMLCLAFFFLLCTGEYTGVTTTDTQPFLLHDVTLYLGTQCLDPLSAALDHIQAATFVTLEFTTQKFRPWRSHWSIPQRRPAFSPCHRCQPAGCPPTTLSSCRNSAVSLPSLNDYVASRPATSLTCFALPLLSSAPPMASSPNTCLHVPFVPPVPCSLMRQR